MTATMSQVNLNTNTLTNSYNGSVGGVNGNSAAAAGDASAGISSMNASMTATAAENQQQQQQQQLAQQIHASHSQSTNGNSNGHNGGSNNSQQNINNHQRALSEHAKQRRKLKSRSVAMPVSDGYFNDHLDAWLENCLKDASNTQLSSSSEFLDFNPNTNPSLLANKNAFAAMQQQHAQHQQSPQLRQQLAQQQQQQQLNYMQQHQQMRSHKLPPQQFTASTTNSPTPGGGTTTNGYSSMPLSQNFLRSMPNYMRPSASSVAAANRFSLQFPSSSSSSYFPQTDGGGAAADFASLPPIVNLLGGVGGGGVGVGSAEHEQNNSTDALDVGGIGVGGGGGSASNPNISRGFRFSDPCLLNPSDNDSKVSEPQTTTRHPSQLQHQQHSQDMDSNHQQQNQNNNNNKFFAALLEQINLLHETNTKIFRNLHETKVDIEALKHTPHWGGGMRHRRDSLSGLSTHSQPMIFGGGFSTHSPSSTYQSGAYAPGMMTDVVREVKEAARVREDAMLNRVKALVEERQWSLNECNLRIMRDIEELKSQVHHLRLERKEANKRITHLETENKYMRQMLATLLNTQRHGNHDITHENDIQRMRKPFTNAARRSQSMNLHYGTIHDHHQHQQHAAAQDMRTSSMSVEEETDELLHIIETPSTISTADIALLMPGKAGHKSAQAQDKRHSLSSTDSSGGAVSTTSAGAGSESNGKSVVNGNAKPNMGEIPSPPNFALISTPMHDDVVVPKKKSSSIQVPNEVNADKLQNELKDAVAARKEADKRIIALEQLVTNLRDGQAVAPAASTTTTNSNHVVKGHSNSATSSTVTSPKSTATTTTPIAAPKRNKLKSTSATTASTPPSTTTTRQNNAAAISKNVTSRHQQVTNTSNGYKQTYSSSSPTHRLSVAGPITDL